MVDGKCNYKMFPVTKPDSFDKMKESETIEYHEVEFLEIKTEIAIVKKENNESDEDTNKNEYTTEERVTDFQIPKVEVICEYTSDNVSEVSKKSKEGNPLGDETKKRKLKTSLRNKKNKASSACKELKLELKDTMLSSSKHNTQDANSVTDSGAVCEVPIKTELFFTDTIDFVNIPTNSQDTANATKDIKRRSRTSNIDDPLDTSQPFNIDTSIFKAQPLKKHFKCKICGKQFHNKNTFRHHVWEHSQSFNCTYCSFKTERKVYLNAHINTKHTKSVSFICDYCNHTTYRRENLIKHINAKHTKIIYFSCSYCSFKTCQKSYLSKHINIKHTHKVVYNCTYCSFSTCIKNSLTSHINAEHTKSIAYKCSHCSYKTFYKSYYNKHVKGRHRDKLKME